MKPVLRQSEFSNYFACPYKMVISSQVKREVTDPMREGLLFEGYTFGKFKDDNEKELIGRKKPETIEGIKNIAITVRDTLLGVGTPFLKLQHETDDFILTGELDWFGEVHFNGQTQKAILDLKYTGDIINAWGSKSRKNEFIQAVTYQYLAWKNYGDLYPFYYCLVESKYSNPIVKVVEVHSNFSDFEWLETQLKLIVSDPIKEPKTGFGTCINKGQRCPYLEHCPHGREWLGQSSEVYFEALLEPDEVVEDFFK